MQSAPALRQSKYLQWEIPPCKVSALQELVGRSQPKGSGQQLNVQMETSDEWSPSGVRTGTGAVQYIYQ